MGCNSHISIEILQEWTGHSAWDTWALDIPESRDYYLYEAMAGVRGEDENALVLPRGIPKDASRAIKFWSDRAGADGHSHSWLHPHEFHATLEKSSKQPETRGETAKAWLAVDNVLTGLAQVYGDARVRLVFFFDN